MIISNISERVENFKTLEQSEQFVYMMSCENNESITAIAKFMQVMFDGLSAWFSNSVNKRVKHEWVDHGGKETHLEDAQFIFSQDAAVADTQRVFDSDAYLEEHLAVFHPSYITECVKHGNIGKVTLGKYFFPPEDVQAIAREQLQYQWDIDGYNLPCDTSSSSDEEEPARLDKAGRSGVNTTGPVVGGNKAQKDKNITNEPTTSNASSNRVKDGVASDVKRKHRSETDSEVFVQSNRLKEIEVEHRRKSPRKGLRTEKDNKMTNSQRKEDRNENENESVQKTVTVERTNKRSSLNTRRKSHSDAEESHYHVSDEDRGASTSERRKRTRNETSAARNEDLEGSEVLRLEDLAKVTGDLEDFIVGTNGCELVKIS